MVHRSCTGPSAKGKFQSKCQAVSSKSSPCANRAQYACGAQNVQPGWMTSQGQSIANGVWSNILQCCFPVLSQSLNTSLARNQTYTSPHLSAMPACKENAFVADPRETEIWTSCHVKLGEKHPRASRWTSEKQSHAEYFIHDRQEKIVRPEIFVHHSLIFQPS